MFHCGRSEGSPSESPWIRECALAPCSAKPQPECPNRHRKRTTMDAAAAADADAGETADSGALAYDKIKSQLDAWTAEDAGASGRASGISRASTAYADAAMEMDLDLELDLDLEEFNTGGGRDYGMEEGGSDGWEEEKDSGGAYARGYAGGAGGRESEGTTATELFRSPLADLSLPKPRVATPAAAMGQPQPAFGAPVETPAPSRAFDAKEAEAEAASTGTSTVVAVAAAERGDYYGFGHDGTYRPYHDALLQYLQTRADHRARSGLLDEEADLDRPAGGGARGGAEPGTSLQPYEGESESIRRQRAMIEDESMSAELNLLKSLSGAAAASSPDAAGSGSGNGGRNEANVWSLLGSLRSLGLDGLLYDDGPDHSAAQRAAVSERVYAKARAGVDRTPAEVVEDFFLVGGTGDGEGDQLPMILARRAELLRWAEECQAQKIGTVPTSGILAAGGDAGATAAAGYLTTPLGGTSAPVGFGGSAAPDPVDLALLQACLVRLKAGPEHWAKALDLCRSSGQPWRAASLAGGLPYGRASYPPSGSSSSVRQEEKEGGMVEYGNPDRALWKRTAWKMSRALAHSVASEPSSSRASTKIAELEGALYALLSDDAESALASPSLRTWEDGLLIHLRSVMGRYVDEVLAAHNDSRRSAGRRYPYRGTEHGQAEREQLSATASISPASEADAFRSLLSSPYREVREEASDPLRIAMAAFVRGSDDALAYVAREGLEASQSSTAMLRFVTHLVLYLDYASPGIFGAVQDQFSDEMAVRDHYLLRYVDLLTSDRGLWHLVALYASLLPEDLLIETFSDFLTSVHDDGFRRKVLRQMSEYFPNGLNLVVLRRTVRILISDNGGDNFGYPFLNLIKGSRQKKVGPVAAKLDEFLSPSDVCKMHSVRWLCYTPDHMPDALVCSNTLLRQLLTASKTEDVVDGEESDPSFHCARVFLTRFLPGDHIETAVRQALEMDGAGDSTQGNLSYNEVEDASAEHGALKAYVDARVAFDRWRDTVSSTDPEVVIKSMRSSATASSVGGSVANKMERRNFVHQKKNRGLLVTDAANEAKEKLVAVLAFEGGWLMNPSDSVDNSIIESEECSTRMNEMLTLRELCLPYAVKLLHAVMNGTAEWMEASVNDAMCSFREEGETMVSELYPGRDGCDQTNGFSPFTPGYWYDSCLSIANIVAKDEFDLQNAFTGEGMVEFIALMAEAQVNLLRCTQR